MIVVASAGSIHEVLGACSVGVGLESERLTDKSHSFYETMEERPRKKSN